MNPGKRRKMQKLAFIKKMNESKISVEVKQAIEEIKEIVQEVKEEIEVKETLEVADVVKEEQVKPTKKKKVV